MSEKAKIPFPVIKSYSITISTPLTTPIVVGTLPDISVVQKKFCEYFDNECDANLKAEFDFAKSLLNYASYKHAILSNMIANNSEKSLELTFTFSSIEDMLSFRGLIHSIK